MGYVDVWGPTSKALSDLAQVPGQIEETKYRQMRNQAYMDELEEKRRQMTRQQSLRSALEGVTTPVTETVEDTSNLDFSGASADNPLVSAPTKTTTRAPKREEVNQRLYEIMMQYPDQAKDLSQIINTISQTGDNLATAQAIAPLTKLNNAAAAIIEFKNNFGDSPEAMQKAIPGLTKLGLTEAEAADLWSKADVKNRMISVDTGAGPVGFYVDPKGKAVKMISPQSGKTERELQIMEEKNRIAREVEAGRMTRAAAQNELRRLGLEQNTPEAKGEVAMVESTAKEAGKELPKLQVAAKAAERNLPKLYKALEDPSIGTGVIGQFQSFLSKLMHVYGDVAARQSMIRGFLGQARQSLGLVGATSDRDVAVMEAWASGGGNPEGFRTVIEEMIRGAEADIALYQERNQASGLGGRYTTTAPPPRNTPRAPAGQPQAGPGQKVQRRMRPDGTYEYRVVPAGGQ